MGQRETITEAFLAAAVEPQQWLGVLAQLASASGSDHAQIIGLGPDYSFGFNWVSDMDDDAHAAADRSELVTPQTNYRVAAGVTSQARIVGEERYEPLKAQLLDDAYLDLCSDLRIPYGCQTNLRVDEGGLIGFALLRSQRAGPTTAEARQLFAEVRDGATAATALQVALEREGHHLVAGGFEAMGTACFVLDRHMQVRAATAPAAALLSAGLVRIVEARVALPLPADDRRLGAILTQMTEGRLLAGSLAVPDGAGVMTLKLHRLPARQWNMGFAPFAILIVKRSSGGGAIDLTVLRDTYALTVSEAEIAVLLHAGQARDAICAARGITRETLRSHLRALFAKLGVSRETEAIHLLHALLD